MYICACKLHLNVDCMIKFGISKIGRPPIIYQTKFTFSSFYLHMIWPIILLEFFMSDLHFAYLMAILRQRMLFIFIEHSTQVLFHCILKRYIVNIPCHQFPVVYDIYHISTTYMTPCLPIFLIVV